MAKLSYPNAADYLRKSNSGVFVEEIDSSIINVTPYYNQTNIVLGCSRQGLINMPLLVNSPEQFTSLFGDIDLTLERKGSYFHRTVLEMLKHSPVICMNLRLTSGDDKYRWVSFSTSPGKPNSSTKTNYIQDFYDTTSGFWARSTDSVIKLSKDKYNNNLPLHFVNMSDKAVSILMYKSTAKGYDVTIEDYYSNPDTKGEQPEYLHPKERVSDFMLDVLIVEGRWENYKELSIHPKWSQYFNKFGIKRTAVDNFINQQEVSVVKKWTVSLIPNFLDKKNNNITISSLINSNINETGILCAYDADYLETSYRTGILDLVGEGLTDDNVTDINYLSYKRNITDYYFLEEKYLDQAGNSFGDHLSDYTDTKTVYNGNGFFNNIRMKSKILSTTFNDESIPVAPVIYAEDSYYIVEGVKVTIKNDITDSIPIKNCLHPGNQLVYVVYATVNGIQFKIGSMTPLDSAIQFPFIPATAIVLAYYIIEKQLNGSLSEVLVPISVDIDGYVTPFRKHVKTLLVADGDNLSDAIASLTSQDLSVFSKLLIEVVQKPNSINPITDAMIYDLKSYVQSIYSNQIRIELVKGSQKGYGSSISFTEDKPSIYFKEPINGWQQVLYFDSIYADTIPTYHTHRLLNLWNWLSTKIVEKETILVDTTGVKMDIDWIQHDHDDNGRFLIFAPKDSVYSSNILKKEFAVYVKDIEAISHLSNNLDLTDTIGDQSIMYESYMDGRLDDGDNVFYSLAEETKVQFTKRQGQSLIIFNEPTFTPYTGKIIVQGSYKNNELFTIINQIVEGQTVLLFVEENTIEEESDIITIYDANEVAKMNISFTNGRLHAAVEKVGDLEASEIYKKEYNEDKEAKEWKITVDIEDVIESTKILVNYNRYYKLIDEGNYIKALPIAVSDSAFENKRDWTRIIDVYRSASNPEQLVVVTDSPMQISVGYKGGIQTESYTPLWKWVSSLNFTVLEGYKVDSASLPDGTESQLRNILSIVGQGTRMSHALTTERVDWRYLVDSFGLGLYAGSKQELAALAEKRNGIAFLNFPSVKYLRRSKTPKFSNNGRLDTSLLLQGGDRKTTGGEKFTLTTVGKSHAAYFAPYVRLTGDISGNLVPPAAYVAGTYMSRKMNVPSKRKWDIVAGNRNGRINESIELEEVFDDEQLADLTELGVNAITTYQKYFYYLSEERTADSYSKSLGQIHSREVLIEIETALKYMLRNYHWMTGNQLNIKNTITTAADNICKEFLNQSAIYDYKNNVILDDELLDNGIGILETYVELVQGFRVLVLRMNILGTDNLG